MHQTIPLFTAEDKQRHPYLISVLNPNSQKVIATAAARIYHAAFHTSQDDWTFSKLRGILVFGRDRDSTANGGNKPINHGEHGLRVREKYWFRLVDMKTDRVVWMFVIPEVFEYNKDRPFFHYFSGTSRKFGFCFDEDEEASVFFKKVTDRTRRHLIPKFPCSKKIKQTTKPSVKPSMTVKTATISGPTPHSFVHVSHVGISQRGIVETSKNIDPAWSTLIADLQGYGITQDVVENNVDFVDGFLAGAKSVHPPVDFTSAAPPRPRKTVSFSTTPQQQQQQQQPAKTVSFMSATPQQQRKMKIHRKPAPSPN